MAVYPLWLQYSATSSTVGGEKCAGGGVSASLSLGLEWIGYGEDTEWIGGGFCRCFADFCSPLLPLALLARVSQYSWYLSI